MLSYSILSVSPSPSQTGLANPIPKGRGYFPSLDAQMPERAPYRSVGRLGARPWEGLREGDEFSPTRVGGPDEHVCIPSIRIILDDRHHLVDPLVCALEVPQEEIELLIPLDLQSLQPH